MTIEELYSKLSYVLSSNPSLKDKEIEWTRGRFTKNKILRFEIVCIDHTWQVVLKIKKDGKNSTYGELLDTLNTFIKDTSGWEMKRLILIDDETGKIDKYHTKIICKNPIEKKVGVDFRAITFRFNDLKFHIYIQIEEIL